MKASALIVRCLENESVQYVFGVPGEEILDIVDSLVDSSIRFIPTRHEQGAAFMADAYGRLTGRAGVCLSTLGPGATNLATGIAGVARFDLLVVHVHLALVGWVMLVMVGVGHRLLPMFMLSHGASERPARVAVACLAGGCALLALPFGRVAHVIAAFVIWPAVIVLQWRTGTIIARQHE